MMTKHSHTILINGVPSDVVSVFDRGLQYGDGVFETIAIKNEKACYWGQHWERLRLGCEVLGIDIPDQGELKKECQALCKDVSQGVLKIIITRGPGGRGYAPPEDSSSSRIVGMYPWPDYSERLWREGIALHMCSTRLGINPSLAGIKHLNRLEQVMASLELHNTGCVEGIMLDVDDRVIEGTRTNLFLVDDGEIITPDLRRCGVRGVMRSVVLDYAKSNGIKTRTEAVTSNRLLCADEVFVTNSIIGIWPVQRIANQALRVGTVSKSLMKAIPVCPDDDGLM